MTDFLRNSLFTPLCEENENLRHFFSRRIPVHWKEEIELHMWLKYLIGS
jgi:hypothetical protein